MQHTCVLVKMYVKLIIDYYESYINAYNDHSLQLEFQDDVEKLTKNVYLLKVRGHTSDDIAVLINNTRFFGTVIVSGKIN